MDKDPDINTGIVGSCADCKVLAETGAPVPGRMVMAGEYAHFFYFRSTPYLMRFTRCGTCRRLYVYFAPRETFHPGPGLYYPFPQYYPNA